MPVSIQHLVDAAYEHLTPADLLDLSPEILQGVSAADAQHLDLAFGITTVREFAESRFVAAAQVVSAAAGQPAFDTGPPRDWEQRFADAPIDHYLQHASSRFRIDFGPVYYRGRLDSTARVLIVGQDPATNEILAQRAFVGHSGQRVQHLLAKLGLSRSYLMLNTFLFSITGQFDNQMEGISREPAILDYRNGLFEKAASDNALDAVLAFGRAARDAVSLWPGHANVSVIELVHPAADDVFLIPSWNGKLQQLGDIVTPDDPALVDLTPYTAPLTANDALAIPRHDLSFGIPDWHGTPAGTASRNGAKEIIWRAP